jgi:uncharacterized protein (TIGR02118 family)
MFKVILLHKRRPGMTVEDFQDHWRHRHGPLVARSPALRRYVQSHALLQGYRKGELIYDGIDEMWFDSGESWERWRNDAAHAEVRADHARFVDSSRAVAMAVDVHVIKGGAIPQDAVKNIEFVNRRPGMPLEPFRAYWRNVHGPIASRIEVIRRYEQNHLRPEAYAGEPAPRYDGLAITWFASTADMKTGAATPEYAITRADEPNFLPDGHLPIIITREHVVLDRAPASR